MPSAVALVTAMVAATGVLHVRADSTTQEAEDCGTGWMNLHRACYRFSLDPLSWEDALISCQSEGGYLLSVSSVAEKNKMRGVIRGLDKKAKWWIGLRHRRGNTWDWLDKGPFSSRVTVWEKGEPFTGGYKECVQFSSVARIKDADCDTANPYICERQEITPRPVQYTTFPITTTSTTTATTPTSPPTTPSTSAPSPSTSISTTMTTTTTPESTTTESTSTAPESTPQMSPTTTTAPTYTTTVTAGIPSTTSSVPTTTPSTTTTTTITIASSSSAAPVSSSPTTTTTTASTSTTTTETTTTTTPEPPRKTTTSEAREKDDKKDKKKKHKEEEDEEEEEVEEEEVDLFALYAGCYLIGTRHDTGKPFLYKPGATTCPAITASQIRWPGTRAGDSHQEQCKHGDGFASFHCGGDPVCWRAEPDIDACASPTFKKILQQASNLEDDTDVEPPEPEEAVALAIELANATTSDDVTAEDVMVTSKVIQSLASSGVGEKLKNKTEVENIVANVVKAGSNLVATNKSRVWTQMAKQDKIRSATSLLVAMETATVAMVEDIDEPTVITTKDENIELELRVLDVSSQAADDTDNIVYNAEDSDNEFSIPVKTLSHLSKGNVAKVVFMTHYSMGDILDDADDDAAEDIDVTVDDDSRDSSAGEADEKEEKPAPRLASYILSASVGGVTEPIKLPEPVSFTMTHIRPFPEGYRSLCSFWSIDESGLGEWSQDGCWVLHSNANQTTCECDHMTNFAVLMAVEEVEISELHVSLLRLTTIVGCIISCMCLLASWVTFTCFTSLQGERNSIHKNLVVCLLVAELLFLTGIDQTQNKLACGLVAGFLHYFFLAAFLWMLMEGVHIVLMLVQVFDASRSRLPYYYAAAYAPPFLIIAISAGLFHQGYGTEQYCWLTTERYFVWSFAGPVAAILLVNAVILIYAMTMVCRHSEYVFSGKEKNGTGGVRSWIQGALALEVLLGLTWILGYFFINKQTLPIAYVFTVLNSLQGLFIFCFHCLFNKKARKEYRRVMKVKRRPSSATSSGAGTQSASLKHHKHDLSHNLYRSHSNA